MPSEYARDLDLLFQQMADRAAADERADLFERLRAHGMTKGDERVIRRGLLNAAASKGKTPSEAERWTEEVLRRFLALLED